MVRLKLDYHHIIGGIKSVKTFYEMFNKGKWELSMLEATHFKNDSNSFHHRQEQMLFGNFAKFL